MRGAALMILALIGGCAPDYEHSAFRCHLPEHSCPGTQRCIAGRCRRGDPTGDGVKCGNQMTCGPDQQCCVYDDTMWLCRSAGEVCPGISALCDGKLDCTGDDLCCADGDAVFCDASCHDYACQDATDCPSTAPNCCSDPATPWGQCSAVSC